MKQLFFTFLLIISIATVAQNIGDTIVVKAFKYGSNTRDTVIQFPNNNLTYEKVIMKYNMRCKNGQVSTSGSPNLGCGQWDYSCNTFILDSSQVEAELKTHPNYIISNFSGSTYSFVNYPTFDYYNFTQTNVSYSIVTENQYTLGVGNTAIPNALKTNEKSGKSQLLFTAAELIGAGLSAGNINGIVLNVANAGGLARFFRVNMRHTTLSALSASAAITTSFTNVYNNNYTFVNGNNRIQFFSPFNWDGVSNVLLEFSFTNSTPSTPIIFNGINSSSVIALYNNNNYALDVSNNGYAIINTSLMSSINLELSVSFWAYGIAPMMPTNTSILYASPTNTAQRSLNIHLPWSDNTIYFDCGNNGNSFDRINKVSTSNDQGGKWNHWAFTKNVLNGEMKIYLNGVLWHYAFSKTMPISIVNMILGVDNTKSVNYKGKINELTIWDKELTQSEIQSWSKRPINPSHPSYSNLIAYYRLNEGTGLLINDTKGNLTSPCTNIAWAYDRGHLLDRMFTETTLRPNVVFFNGTYNLTTNTLTVKDSLQHNANSIQQFSITSNATVTPLAHDLVVLSGTNSAYNALSNIYNGDTGVLTGTSAVSTTSTITITNLNYYNRYPFFSEIMSFVTPYGIGINYGPTGKSWFYDVTDFTPLLKGPKRIIMNMGGEFQEQMDIDFWFIVGTPPRNVLQFKQLWQGAGRDGQASIGSILNNTRYAPLTVPILNSGQSFKVRSTITGHGSEGEFGQNGGNVNHYLNINGGANEFSWQISQNCSSNPIIAQGGTWVYDRQGWCPGQSSLIKENYITPYVTAGSTATIDYNCSAPQNPSGDYRYIQAHQLITYSGANHSLDANLVDVLMPSNKVLYSKVNPICSNPVILVQNTGSTTITNLSIDYWLNNASIKQNFVWTGNLNFMDTTTIKLPIGTLWQTNLQTANNQFYVELKTANSSTDQYVYNNKYNSSFTVPDAITGSLTVEFKTNNFPTENTYTIYDDNGNVVSGSSNLVTANTLYTDNYNLNGCYKIVVTDAGGDGIQWWANSSQGTGFMRLKDASGTIIKIFQPDFGNRFEYSFTTQAPLSINKNNLSFGINLYPNPAHDSFKITGNDLQNSNVVVTNVLGQIIDVPIQLVNDELVFNTKALITGVYTITLKFKEGSVTKKVIIE